MITGLAAVAVMCTVYVMPTDSKTGSPILGTIHFMAMHANDYLTDNLGKPLTRGSLDKDTVQFFKEKKGFTLERIYHIDAISRTVTPYVFHDNGVRYEYFIDPDFARIPVVDGRIIDGKRDGIKMPKIIDAAPPCYWQGELVDQASAVDNYHRSPIAVVFKGK